MAIERNGHRRNLFMFLELSSSQHTAHTYFCTLVHVSPSADFVTDTSVPAYR